ncbi:MAG TPA: ribokinase [Roseiflexaceae bacterium]|nr:ribokinase [Roseiflexaceae bacterium]
MSVVVFGSINMDLVVRAPRLPAPGETVAGHTFFTASGGKGANQAVACARLGAHARMIGRVGDDVFGATLRDNLRGYGVDVSGVGFSAGPSGVAVIAVDDAAENTIVIVAGANGTIGMDDLTLLEDALAGATVLLLQLEVPIAAVTAAAQAARRHGVTVLLDPAPARELPAELYAAADIITPNETEAAALVGFAVKDRQDAERAGQALLARGARAAVIKMGSQGAYWTDGTRSGFAPAFRVEAVDTVAAGDAFNGGLAAAQDAGLPLEQAIRWGMAAGALSVTKPGAQQSMPTREELLALINRAA